ncbi:Hypothetical predicted protein [Marmota monax]|uniref:Uncharacterized protein n=1 Tax=Marmota monax TaxID=9995 RepID=A0A5E4B1Q5_MARMO|nr:Hypothetical predicted protein [Marmota monax]
MGQWRREAEGMRGVRRAALGLQGCGTDPALSPLLTQLGQLLTPPRSPREQGGGQEWPLYGLLPAHSNLHAFPRKAKLPTWSPQSALGRRTVRGLDVPTGRSGGPRGDEAVPGAQPRNTPGPSPVAALSRAFNPGHTVGGPGRPRRAGPGTAAPSVAQRHGDAEVAVTAGTGHRLLRGRGRRCRTAEEPYVESGAGAAGGAGDGDTWHRHREILVAPLQDKLVAAHRAARDAASQGTKAEKEHSCP